MLYFDHNATHPLSRVARDAWLEATERYIGNPSSPHRIGARADTALTEAREKVAGWLGCRPGEIVWTSGATESNNAALRSVASLTDGEAWISAIEHPCVIEATRRYFAGRHRLMPVTDRGIVDLDWLAEALLHSRPAVVAVMAANNETGVIQPWQDMLALCHKHGVLLLCDAAQVLGRIPSKRLGECDFMSACAHKYGGPTGVGILRVPKEFQALMVGGPQEEGRRAGTENVAGILSAVAALEDRFVRMSGPAIAERLAVRSRFESTLRRTLPGVEILGAGTDRLWNTVSAVMPEVADCRQRWVVKLDKLGIAVSTGSACASGKERMSHVLEAMRVEPARAARVLRFSSGWETAPEGWDTLLDGLVRAARELGS